MNNPVDVYRNADRQRQNVVLAGTAPSTGQDRLDLNMVVGTLQRRRVLFIGVFLAIFLLAAFLTFRQSPSYTASSIIVIDAAQEQVTPQREQVLQDSNDTSSPVIDTEVQVILSNELANKVAEALNLDRLAQYDPSRMKPSRRKMLWARLTGQQLPISQRLYDPQAQREYVVNQLESGLKVLRTGTTFAITLSFSAGDPNFAAMIANEYAKQYVQQALDRKRNANSNALAFLSKRIEELRQQAQTDTKAVQQYRIAHGLLTTNAAQLTEQEVSTYDQQVASARAAAAEDRARLATAEQQLRTGANGEDVGEALGAGIVGGLRSQRAQLSAQLADLKTRYGPRHPDVIKLQEQLADVDRSIGAEVNRVMSALKAKTAVSNQRLSSISGSLGGARGELENSNRALVGFDDLTRKAAASQGLYEAYLNRYKQAAAQEGTEKPDARIINFAQVPGAPSSPNIPLNMVLAVLLGIGGGLAASFIAELAFRGMTTGEDVESRLEMPYLGALPLVRSVFKWKGPPTDALIERPHSAFAEAYRSLKAATNYSVDAVVQIVGITSALPLEGKSTTAACLARIAALDGERALLVDCDVRRRSVNRMVATPDGPGLIDVIRGTAGIDDVLVQDAPSGAWLLPINGGRIEVGDVFVGEAFASLLAELRGRFTYIVLDLPPILPIVDSRVIATLADAVVIVARWRKTADHAVRNALRLLPRAHVNIAGVALSQVDIRKQARFGHGDPTHYYDQYKEYYS